MPLFSVKIVIEHPVQLLPEHFNFLSHKTILIYSSARPLRNLQPSTVKDLTNPYSQQCQAAPFCLPASSFRSQWQTDFPNDPDNCSSPGNTPGFR